MSNFRKHAERVFRTANPDATGVQIEWTYGPVRVTWADGSAGMSGIFTATAAGFRTRPMHASQLDGRVIVR